MCPRCFENGPRRSLLQVVLGIIALGAGSFGACFALLGGIGVAGSTWRDWLPIVGVGGAGIAVAAACVWGIIRLNIKPR